MESNLAASMTVFNKNNVWVDDKMVFNCYACSKEFSFFIRKHHCRNCGNVFCYSCINQSIIIPNFITDRPDPADYWNITYYIKSLKKNEEKVCKKCYNIIKCKIKAYRKIIEIFNNPISIDKIKEMSNSLDDVKDHYIDHLRNIQYYLPNHKYTEIDKKLLKINSIYFSKHSKYLVHFIKSTDWKNKQINKDINETLSNMDNNSEQLESLINIINNDKIKTCDELYCTRTCQEQLSCDDCINILYSNVHILPPILLKYLFNIIKKSPEQIILCHLSFFVTLIKNNFNKSLINLLFDLLTQTKKLIYHTFWFLNNLKEKANIQELTNINNFIKLIDPDLVKIMHQEYIFFIGLIDNLNDPKKYLLNVFDKYKPISLPYEPDIQLSEVDLENIIVKISYTKPVIILFKTTNNNKIKLLFKNESIMNDVTVLNLMTLCDIILSENLNTNFGVVIYPTMPLSLNSGMIEIIDNAETIHAISNNKKTILQHIIEKNENKIISDVLDRYMFSLVSYTLHSYFIGLGDRHLQNIMITDDGAIFHIDFGFILGTDAYPLTSADIKLNTGMLDVIGGIDSLRYDTYLNFCANGVILLRKYFNIFFILLSQDPKFKISYIQKFVMSRFQPRQIDDVVVSELMTIIKQSHNAYSDSIRDFLHYHTQEKTVQHGVTRIFKSTIGVMKNLTNN